MLFLKVLGKDQLPFLQQELECGFAVRTDNHVSGFLSPLKRDFSITQRAFDLGTHDSLPVFFLTPYPSSSDENQAIFLSFSGFSSYNEKGRLPGDLCTNSFQRSPGRK
jgi:hypothetical protein